jgi:hypothetical protein
MKLKRFEEGGSFTELGGSMDILGGAVKSIYGVKQLREANREYDRAKAAAPSLETPAQFYENYKNAYDSELARIETDAIQGNLATSVQALQGAGGRALVGGLGAATAQAQNSQNRMLAQERQMRMASGQQLARAEESAIKRKETRSQTELLQAQQSAAAARQNIVGGITDVATGAMAGGFTPIGKAVKGAAGYLADTPAKFSQFMTDRQIKKTRDAVGGFGYGETNENMQNFILNQNAFVQDVGQSWQDYGLKKGMESMQAGLKQPISITTEILDRPALMQQQLLEEQTAKALPPQSTTANRVGAGGSWGGGSTASGIPSDQEMQFRLGEIQATSYNPNGFIDPITGQFIAAPNAGAGMDFGIKSIPGTYKQGGMMTNGSFSHSSNPIDIVQNGVKVGEATGGEYILNPEQAAKIKKESSFARKLFKQFEKKAKSNK